MGKKRERGSSEIEDLRGRLREAEKLNKQLLKRLGQSRKALSKAENLIPDQHLVEEPQPIEEPNKGECPQCGKSAMITDLGVRELINCPKCGYRKSRKK